jgi:hypothetical protein
MPGITIKGLRGIPPAMRELAQALGTDIAEKSISYSAQQTKQRLEQDTPVITGRLKRSTVLRKDSATKATLGQFAPYANIVNNRRGYWNGAIRMADLWPEYYRVLVGERIGLVARKYSGQ